MHKDGLKMVFQAKMVLTTVLYEGMILTVYMFKVVTLEESLICLAPSINKDSLK